MQHCNVQMQIQVTYTAKVVLAGKKNPNKSVCFFFRGYPRRGGGVSKKNSREFFFQWPPDDTPFAVCVEGLFTITAKKLCRLVLPGV